MFVHEAIAATFLGQPVPHRSDKDNARVAAGTQYRLLATLWLSAEKYAFYSRYFAISKVTYGWLGRSPTSGLRTKLWNALKAGQRVTFMANKWVRAMVHVEDSTTSMSLRLQTFFVYGIWTKGQATWNSIGGTPVAARRKWMCDTGWNPP